MLDNHKGQPGQRCPGCCVYTITSRYIQMLTAYDEYLHPTNFEISLSDELRISRKHFLGAWTRPEDVGNINNRNLRTEYQYLEILLSAYRPDSDVKPFGSDARETILDCRLME